MTLVHMTRRGAGVRGAAVLTFGLVLALLLLACETHRKGETSAASGGAGASAKATSSAKGQRIPIPSDKLEQVLNPAGLPPYSGATGAVEGVVRMTGDSVPEVPNLKDELPVGKCLAARQMYGRLVREGKQREVADVLVAVTQYEGFVPAKSLKETIIQRDCAYDRRTVAMTFGQMLDVQNKGPEAGMPQLIGVPSTTLLVAIPGGEPISLLAPKPGQYRLIDRSHPFAISDVYVLAYPTATVTDAEGRFKIDGIPVGEVSLSLLLPVTGQTLNQSIKIKPGQTTKLELELPFDKAKHAPPPATSSTQASKPAAPTETAAPATTD